jgi:hypothetical protein
MEELLIGLAGAVAGAVIGALATYLLDTRKAANTRLEAQREEARRQQIARATVATALLLDLRGLEPLLLQFYHATKPGLWVGQEPPLYFESLRGELRHFGPDTIPAVDDFYRRARDLFAMLASVDDPTRRSDAFHYRLRCSAGFALQAIPDAKAALESEGGKAPTARTLDIVYPPDLPKIPKRSFPDQAVPGKALPQELK